MRRKESVLESVIAHIFGHKYYANIVSRSATDRVELCCFIFPTKDDAENHKIRLSGNRSFNYLQTISFRSRNEYVLLTDNQGYDYNRCTFAR